MDTTEFQLTPSEMRELVNNREGLEAILQNKDNLNLFLIRFPFDKLLNFTLQDPESLSVNIKLLDMISDYDFFYKHQDGCNYTLEFILICLCNIGEECEEILLLFELLVKILDKIMPPLSFKTISLREQMIEVMIKMTNYKIMQESKFPTYSPILRHILHPEFSESLYNLTNELFRVLKEKKATSLLLDICKGILKDSSLTYGHFTQIWEWIVDDCTQILAEISDGELIGNSLECLEMFSACFACCGKNESSELFNRFYKNLAEMADCICELVCEDRLRSNALKLLEFILNHFCYKEQLSCYTNWDIFKELNSLPVILAMWPQSGGTIFFTICHLCVLHSRLVWNNSNVLDSMRAFLYLGRFSCSFSSLKSIYFLYPILTESLPNRDYYVITLGRDLIDNFTKLSSLPYIYSYTGLQLKWLLQGSLQSTKSMILKQWLNQIDTNQSLETILIDVITNSKFEIDLLVVILQYNSDQELGVKAARILRKIANYDISKTIALSLPLSIDRMSTFCNLIVAKPGLPDDMNDCILICTLMGAILPSLDDPEILKDACTFSSNLLSKCKLEPTALKQFCQNLQNIRYLVDTVGKVDDEVAIEIIRLIKVIVLTQRMNLIKFESVLTDDFSSFLKGTTEKIEKSLKLLYYIFNYKHSIVTFDSSRVFRLYRRMLDSALNPQLQVFAYKCILQLLKRFRWLVETMSSSIHIEMMCLTASHKKVNVHLLKVLDFWLMAIRRALYDGSGYIPESAIKSFACRMLTNRKKAEEYLKTLDQLRSRTKGWF